MAMFPFMPVSAAMLSPQMPTPTRGQQLTYGLEQFLSPENQNANLGLASALLAQSGWAPVGQSPTLGQAFGQALPAFQQGQQLDRQKAEQMQWQELAKGMGLGDMPASAMPGLVTEILKSQYGAAPADLRTFNEMTKGLTDEEREKARRVALGLEARPSSAMPWLNLGDEFVQPNTGRRFERGLPPEQAPDLKGRQAEAEAAGRAAGELSGEKDKKAYNAADALSVITEIEKLLPQATGSGAGAVVDATARFFGGTTEGAKAARRLKVLAPQLILKIPRMEGPQSDKDTQLYREAAGNLGDETLTTEERMEALQTLKELNQRYAHLNGAAPKQSGGFTVRRKIK